MTRFVPALAGLLALTAGIAVAVPVAFFPNPIPNDKDNFLERYGGNPDPSSGAFYSSTDAPIIAEHYYEDIDPTTFVGPGTARPIGNGLTVRGCGANLPGHLVPGDQIRINGQVRTVKTTGTDVAEEAGPPDVVAREVGPPETETRQPISAGSPNDDLLTDERQTQDELTDTNPGQDPERVVVTNGGQPENPGAQASGCTVYDPNDEVTVWTAFDVSQIPNYEPWERVGEKTTLARWQQINDVGGADEIQAYYFNGGDLAFGRRMVGDFQIDGPDAWPVYAVSNYIGVDAVDSADLAFLGGTAIATVAMEYSPVSGLGATPMIKFYVFDGTGARVPMADLDGRGDKYVPGLCMTCHGGDPEIQNGTVDSQGIAQFSDPSWPDLQSHYLPFDLDSFDYPSFAGADRVSQEQNFGILNDRIRQTNPPQVLLGLVHGWYGLAENASVTTPITNYVQNSAYVPLDWQSQEPVGSVFSSDDLYLDVVKPYCRTCHVSQTRFNAAYDWDSFTEFDNLWSLIEYDFCELEMPHALVTYENFWVDEVPLTLETFANTGMFSTGWTGAPGTPCRDLFGHYTGQATPERAVE